MTGRPAGLAGPFVGRARELAAAAKLLADDERTGVVLVGGEAGLGKTRLVEEILAAHPGMDVVRGGAVPRATPSSFELVRTAVQPVVQTWREIPDRLVPIAPAAQAVLLADAPSAWNQTDPMIPLAERIRAAAEVLRFLHEDHTIFVFDDVHWADPESLEAIDRLMASGPLHATIIVTYRPEALRRGHPVNNFLARAERRAHALQLRLEPLRHDEVAEYLAATRSDVGEQTVDRVHARTGGNPLFLSELVGAADDDQDLTDHLPWTLAEILRPEIDRLPDEVRAVAEAVSVLGADAEFDLVAAAVSADEQSLLTRLRHLVDAGILVESGPDHFAFRHELVREAVADGLFTREHRRIHAAAHDALVAAGSCDSTALITHAAGAGRDAEAADAARDAALAALAQGSSHQALSFAEQALLVRRDDIELLRTAVSAGWMTSQYEPAVHHLEQWDDLVRNDPAGRAEVLHWRVRLLWEDGDTAGADAAADDLGALIEQLDDDAVRAQALADLAQHRMLSGASAAAIELADRALEIAAGTECAAAALQARAEKASAQLDSRENRSLGITELERVSVDAEAAGEWVIASRALNNVPILATADPRRHLERMRSAAQRSGLTCISTDGYRFSLLELAEYEGDRDEYESRLEAVLDESESDPMALALAAKLAAGEGRFDDARGFVDRMGGAGGWFGPTLREGLRAVIEMQENGSTAAVLSWLAGEPCGHVKARLLLDGAASMIDAGIGPQLLAALEAAGRDDDVDAAVAGLVAELRGDLDAADEFYRSVIDADEKRGVVVLAEVELGRARIARARGGDPEPHLASAADRLRCWPGRLRDRIEAMLGIAPSRDGAGAGEADEPGRLTPREREVALLVSRGLTNGGIAEELYISTKTASVHVSNILAKLAMSSRAEIAAWVASGGLGDDGRATA